MKKRIVFSNSMFYIPLGFFYLSFYLSFLLNPQNHFLPFKIGTIGHERTLTSGNSPVNTAFILEGRFLPKKIKYVVENAQKFLGPSWIIMIASSAHNVPRIRDVMEKDDSIDSSSIEYIAYEQNIESAWDYNNIVKNVSLWQKFRGEFVLFFQTDSILCSASPYKIEDFFAFDYIGGYTPPHENFLTRCKETPQCYSNGGLSLRRISTAIQVFEILPPVSFVPAGRGKQKNPEFWEEDMYFYEGMSRLNGTMPDKDFSLAMHFSFNTWAGPTYVTFGGHKVTQKSETIDFRAYCPEYVELENIVEDDIFRP